MSYLSVIQRLGVVAHLTHVMIFNSSGVVGPAGGGGG